MLLCPTIVRSIFPFGAGFDECRSSLETVGEERRRDGPCPGLAQVPRSARYTLNAFFDYFFDSVSFGSSLKLIFLVDGLGE